VRAAALYLQPGASADENRMETDWQIACVVDNSRIVSGQDAKVREETGTVQTYECRIWGINNVQGSSGKNSNGVSYEQDGLKSWQSGHRTTASTVRHPTPAVQNRQVREGKREIMRLQGACVGRSEAAPFAEGSRSRSEMQSAALVLCHVNI